ncbi:MAG TPA: MoaD/ThiS family protein [Jatrophihabitantaceae bacterium]
MATGLRRSSAIATIRFWAGARRAAGHAEAPTTAPDIAALRDELAARPELVAVMRVAAFLVDGQPAGDTTKIPADAFVDVLPPFAGG